MANKQATLYRVRFVIDNDASSFEECNGEPRPLKGARPAAVAEVRA